MSNRYAVTNAPEGDDRTAGLRVMPLAEAQAVAAQGQRAGYASRVVPVADDAVAQRAAAVAAQPVVGDYVQVTLPGPSFGRVGRIIHAGRLDMADRLPVDGLLMSDLAVITPDQYLAARFAAASATGHQA